MSGSRTGQPTIVARGLKKGFFGVPVVRGLNLEVARGKATGLIGANGAGKTTIFNLLSGELKPDAGTVEIEGQDATGHSASSVARMGIGRSFQEVRLFENMTSLENCTVYAQRGSGSLLETLFRPRHALLSGRESKDRGREALALVGLEKRAGVYAGDLSYAEQKLLSVARLLAMGSHTLLLDEPASGLDHEGVKVVMDSVRALVERGKTVLLIEHNLDVVSGACDTVSFLDQGQILAEGSPEEVFARPELAEVYFGV